MIQSHVESCLFDQCLNTFYYFYSQQACLEYTNIIINIIVYDDLSEKCLNLKTKLGNYEAHESVIMLSSTIEV